MLHLRIVSPPDLTASVLQALADDAGVTHITADRGGATEPPGDLRRLRGPQIRGIIPLV